MFRRAHTIVTASLALALAPAASAQLFGNGGLVNRWNSPQWHMPADTPLSGIPGRKNTYPQPTQPTQIYAGLPQEQLQQLPMPQLRNTGDRYDSMVAPVFQGVANFVQPLPGGAPFAQSLQQNLVQPDFGSFMGNALPQNLPAVARHMQNNPGAQFSQQMQQIAGDAGARHHPTLAPPTSGITGMMVRRGESRARDQVMGSLQQVGGDAARFGMNYWPSVGNVPNYVQAGRALFGGAGAPPAAGGAPAQDMPQ